MATAPSSELTSCEAREQNSSADLRIYGRTEDAVRLDLFLLHRPEWASEITIPGSILRWDFGAEEEAQTCALEALRIELAKVRPEPSPSLDADFSLTAAEQAFSVDRDWTPENDCNAGIFQTSTPKCSRALVTLKLSVSIALAWARVTPPIADKPPRRDQRCMTPKSSQFKDLMRRGSK